MINILDDLIRSFEKLNNLVGSKIFSKKTLIEAHANSNQFKNIKQDIINYLHTIHDFDFNYDNIDDLEFALVHLHIKVSAVGHRILEARELIEVIMGRYRKLIHDQGMAKE